MFAIPEGLHWLRAEESGRTWLESLPRLVSDAARRWELTVGPAYGGSHVSYVAPATRADGTAAVLKVPWPHPEAVHEALALSTWDGAGAVKLLDSNADALLIERCEPGTSLSTVDSGTALDVLVRLLPRLWRPAGPPFTSLVDEATGWADRLVPRFEAAGRPFDRRLVDVAVDTLRGLVSRPGEPVLLHQDLHGDNVLRARREPWLAIDPKPLAGEREFGVAPVVRSAELGDARADVWYRFDRLTAELGLDRDRARGWTVGQTVAWAFEGDWVGEWHLAVARWLLEDRPATRR